MTYASMPTLRHQEEILAEWEPRVLGTEYDGRMVPAAEKSAVLIGMAMTEKQGGSDVRANTTRAVAIDGGGPGGAYEITGHKWFCSAPMCDAFLTLAYTETGLSCFLVPRWRPDGTRNPFFIQRLKDKVGNRSNASSEIEYRGTWARMVGEEGRGVRTIIEMVHHTRLDCVAGSAGLMRQAVAQAVHHANHRSAFGRRLVEQPLMQNVLADLALEAEAATAAMLRLARAYDAGPRDPGEQLFARLATAVVKYWVCKRWPVLAAEALECLGGNGYVEESLLPRNYREAPLNSIWEGSGNVICLDVLRAMARGPEVADAFFAEVGAARGGDRRLDAFVDAVRRELGDFADAELRARRLVERLALALQGSLLVRHAPTAVADAFCASRLAGDRGLAFGTLPAGTDCAAIIERERPE
jgi:putative acyl-CoA dehydrogenase